MASPAAHEEECSSHRESPKFLRGFRCQTRMVSWRPCTHMNSFTTHSVAAELTRRVLHSLPFVCTFLAYAFLGLSTAQAQPALALDPDFVPVLTRQGGEVRAAVLQ